MFPWYPQFLGQDLHLIGARVRVSIPALLEGSSEETPPEESANAWHIVGTQQKIAAIIINLHHNL